MQLEKVFLNSISSAEKTVLNNLGISLEKGSPLLSKNILQEELKNINRKINIEHKEFFSYKNKKVAYQCAYKNCKTFLSPENKSNYCKVHQQRFMGEVNMFTRDLDYISKINIVDYKPSSELQFILSFVFKKLDQLQISNYEAWNTLKIVILTLRRYPKIVYSFWNDIILNEFSSYSNIPKKKVVNEVKGLVTLFEGILIFVQSYFAELYLKNIDISSIKSTKPDEQIKENIIYESKLTTNFWANDETIKNTCKFNNQTGCKSRKGKLKKIFKTKELAFLYARKNQYVYLCNKNGLGFHIATTKSYL